MREENRTKEAVAVDGDLSVAVFESAMIQFANMVDERGLKINVKPAYLIHSFQPSLEVVLRPDGQPPQDGDPVAQWLTADGKTVLVQIDPKKMPVFREGREEKP